MLGHLSRELLWSCTQRLNTDMIKTLLSTRSMRHSSAQSSCSHLPQAQDISSGRLLISAKAHATNTGVNDILFKSWILQLSTCHSLTFSLPSFYTWSVACHWLSLIFYPFLCLLPFPFCNAHSVFFTFSSAFLFRSCSLIDHQYWSTPCHSDRTLCQVSHVLFKRGSVFSHQRWLPSCIRTCNNVYLSYLP